MSEITVRLDEWVAQDLSRLERWKGFHRGTFDQMVNELLKEAVYQELDDVKRIKTRRSCWQKGQTLYGEHEAEVLEVLKETESKLREILGVRANEGVAFRFSESSGLGVVSVFHCGARMSGKLRFEFANGEDRLVLNL